METTAGAAPKLCSTYLHLFVLALIICLGALTPEAQELPPEELEALLSVGQKLGKSWNFDVNPCNNGTGGWITTPDLFPGWKNNVTCECKSTVCHVVSILLKGQNLTGTLPEELVNLTSLRELDLTRNYLSGKIPAIWASLPLTTLSLLGNRISGKIPKEIGTITTLLELVLEDNQIEGVLPPELGNMTNLARLLLSSNNFTGPLPVELGKLKNLTDFRINDNGFTGTIPDFIQNWTKLRDLHIQGTSLRGPLPSSISALTNLEDLRISDLSGSASPFPRLQNLASLQYLILRNCLISDELPMYFGDGNKKDLRQLDLSFNNLTGTIPDNFASLQLNYLYLTNNMLTGTIPGWITGRSLKADVSYNNFTGEPISNSCVRNNFNLVASYSSTETISASCLRKNLPCLEQARNYELFIDCGGPGTVIGQREYEADTNELGEASFYLSSNGRWAVSNTGQFMDRNLKSYIATANESQLSMPNRHLYTTARLSPLSLRYYGLCLQEGSYNVTLHFAEIEFTDDQTFSSLGRRIFDVSIQGKKVLTDFNIQNQSNGHPGGEVVRTFTTNVTSLTNNTLEIHLLWAGKGTTAIPVRGVYGPLISAITVTPNFKPNLFERSKLSAGAIAGIVLASCVVFSLILGVLRMKGYLGGEDPRDKELRRDLALHTGYYTLRQIKEATNSFDPANKIGEGGFGPVYKGQLPDGSTIAVKQLSSKSKQGNREFVNEIGMISALQHPNLVKLFGCCIEGNQLLLIYEYMENNSLARALFGPEESRLKLDWPTRRKICLGIARGLAYLHEESRLKIVHRDIKATNVLLDKNCDAKISDFGLAKLDEEENTHISTRIAGTIGYMAPEYAMRGYLTDKADVYSFGIVALEIVSGKSNTNYMPKEECVYLMDWAYVLQERGDLLALVDPILRTDFSKEEALNMLNLAFLCTNPSPTLRPRMSTVVSMLEGQTAVPAVAMKSSSSSSTNHWRFKAIEMLSQHSQTQSMSMEGPWIDSSISNPSRVEETDYSSKGKSQADLIDISSG